MQNNFPNGFPTGRYGPYGTNDNNMARQHVPSNVFPPNGGLNGNPFNRFNPLTTNTMANMSQMPSMSNFKKAFQQNTPLIEPQNYANQNNLLHNNVGPSVINETIVEYKINIDSLDRDITVYPDPFSFAVKFHPVGDSYDKREVPINPYDKRQGTKTVESFVKGTPHPHINKLFRNVKYIKMISINLPQKVCDKEDTNLLEDRFVLLRIKELDDDRGRRVFDTGESSIRLDKQGNEISYQQPFARIECDKILNKNFYSGTIYDATKEYKQSLLGVIKRLTFEFFDSCGNPIKADNLFTGNELKCAIERGEPISVSDPKHPLNKKNQVSFTFVIGVVESQINNNTQFER